VTIDNNGVHKAQNPVRDSYYSFEMNGNELLIFEEHEQNKLLLLDDEAHAFWSNHIPFGMYKLYSHWLCFDQKIVLFRPVAFQNRTIYYTLNSSGLYKVPRQYQKRTETFTDEVVLSFDKFLVLGKVVWLFF
jgi:hypothetical protein